MDKTLQDLAWRVLPAEVKELAKGIFQEDKECIVCAGAALVSLFGHHNLTYDNDENAEILCVFRKRVQELYAEAEKSDDGSSYFGGYESALSDLFGSKYLPDNVSTANAKVDSLGANVDNLKVRASIYVNELNIDKLNGSEPKSAEPKFKVGDKVRVIKKGTVYIHFVGEIIDIDNSEKCYVLFPHGQDWFHISDLKPYAEPTDNPIPSNSGELNSQEADSQPDHILKASFSKELRLNIATQFCTAILSNPALTNLMTAPGNIAELAIKSTDIFLDEYEKGLTE